MEVEWKIEFQLYNQIIIYVKRVDRTYFVTLNTLNSLSARRADNPKLLARSWKLTQNTSNTDPNITIVSNLNNNNMQINHISIYMYIYIMQHVKIVPTANYEKTYLLKDELKNVAGPNAYALIAISNMKAHKNTNSA